MAVLALSYGYKTWVIRQSNETSSQVSEMMFFRSVKSCTKQDLLRNDVVLQEFGIFSLVEQAYVYYKQSYHNVLRMAYDRLPKLAFLCIF